MDLADFEVDRLEDNVHWRAIFLLPDELLLVGDAISETAVCDYVAVRIRDRDVAAQLAHAPKLEGHSRRSVSDLQVAGVLRLCEPTLGQGREPQTSDLKQMKEYIRGSGLGGRNVDAPFALSKLRLPVKAVPCRFAQRELVGFVPLEAFNDTCASLLGKEGPAYQAAAAILRSEALPIQKPGSLREVKQPILAEGRLLADHSIEDDEEVRV